MKSYVFLDSGDGWKLEQFGEYRLVRPCSQAVWKVQLPKKEWDSAHARFDRDKGNRWYGRERLPNEWRVVVGGLTFRIAPTDFGHVGVFPEHQQVWRWMKKPISARASAPAILNLFAYSGGATLASAAAGAEVCHLDASKGMVAWARENARLNGLEERPIRWIVDDVTKFLDREIRRKRRYHGILLDPPTYGRGSGGEVFKIERDLPGLLEKCRALLSSDRPLFVWLSCHTPGMTPLVLRHLLSQAMDGLGGEMTQGEMVIEGKKRALPLPNGTFARWSIE